jgi:2-phospho-L-lactate guanylyltransferase (CobY/MobA/RfbA family)
MSSLLIPIAPFSATKSRLKDCFSVDQLKDFTIAMFKDLINTLDGVNCFEHKIVYCNASEILELAEENGLISINEDITDTPKLFDEVISEFNKIAIERFSAKQTTFAFLDLILITAKNFYEINALLQKNQLVICPDIHSAGISILSRNPPDITPSFFSDPNTPSLVALLNNASQNGIRKIIIYDSFRAGFDMDIKHDLVLAYEYLKIFNLRDTEVFKFLKNNLNLSLKKKNANDNRNFEMLERK